MTLCLSALSSEAQYVVAYRGEVVPFDTAVITNAPTFKLESRKLQLQEEIIATQQEAVWSLESQLKVADLQLQAERGVNQHLQGELNVTQAAVREMSPQLDRALEKVEKEGRWYKKDGVQMGLGFLLAFLLLR